MHMGNANRIFPEYYNGRLLCAILCLRAPIFEFIFLLQVFYGNSSTADTLNILRHRGGPRQTNRAQTRIYI